MLPSISEKWKEKDFCLTGRLAGDRPEVLAWVRLDSRLLTFGGESVMEFVQRIFRSEEIIMCRYSTKNYSTPLLRTPFLTRNVMMSAGQSSFQASQSVCQQQGTESTTYS